MMKRTRTHWQWYKNLFKVTFFRYLIFWFAIVPILIKILGKLPETISLQTAPRNTIEIQFGLPFHWELLWLSSFSFVISFGLYKLFCPNFITTYPDYNKYLEHDHSPRWIVHESATLLMKGIDNDKFIERLEEKKLLLDSNENLSGSKPFLIRISENQTNLFIMQNKKVLSMPIINPDGGENTSKTEIAQKEIFWEIFGRYASSRSFIRLIILILLIVSLALFLAVLVENIYAGLDYLF